MQPQMVMYDEEFQQISGVCERLAREANATERAGVLL